MSRQGNGGTSGRGQEPHATVRVSQADDKGGAPWVARAKGIRSWERAISSINHGGERRKQLLVQNVHAIYTAVVKFPIPRTDAALRRSSAGVVGRGDWECREYGRLPGQTREAIKSTRGHPSTGRYMT